MKKILYILIGLTCNLSAYGGLNTGDEEPFQLINDLSSRWMIYEKSSNSFLPFIPGNDNGKNDIYFFIDSGEFRTKWLQISHSNDYGLFVNGKLERSEKGESTRTYYIDSLFQKYGSNKLLFSIYSKEGFRKINTLIVVKNNSYLEATFNNDFLSINENKVPQIWNFLKIASILLIIFLTLLINIDRRTFTSYFNIIRTFSRPSNDEFVAVSHKINKVDLLFIVSLSLIMGFIILNIMYSLDISEKWLLYPSIGQPFLSWILISAILVFWYFAKVVVITIFSNLFNLREIKNIHLFEYLRITSFYGIIVFCIGLLMLYIIKIDYKLIGIILTRSLFIISMLRLFILFYKISNTNSHKKLFLFAYICTAELIPMIIGLKLILNSALIYYIV